MTSVRQRAQTAVGSVAVFHQHDIERQRCSYLLDIWIDGGYLGECRFKKAVMDGVFEDHPRCGPWPISSPINNVIWTRTAQESLRKLVVDNALVGLLADDLEQFGDGMPDGSALKMLKRVTNRGPGFLHGQVCLRDKCSYYEHYEEDGRCEGECQQS